MDDANVPLHPTSIDGSNEQQREKPDGNQRREGTWDLFREYLHDAFDKDSYESFAHAWHKAAAPDTTASLLISLALSLSGSLAGIFIVIGRIFHPDWHQALWFIGVHLSCGLAIIVLTESDRVEPPSSKRTKLDKGARWILKLIFMSFYVWRIKRSLDNFFRKTRIKRKANKAFKGRQTTYVVQSEIKTASESRLIYVKESDLDRLENSVRGFSLASLSIYFYMYSDRCKSMAWFSRDAQTFGTLLWCLVTTSWASTAFEQRYHEFAYIFHFYDRVYRRYSRLSMMETILIFFAHFLRLVCKLHIIGYLLCLSYSSAIWATMWQPLWSFVSHHFLYYLGLYHLPPLLHFKNFKRFLFLDHLVSSSPVTLLCSLGKKKYSQPGQRNEGESCTGSLLRSFLKTVWEETPKRLGVIVFVNDLLPLLLSQACLSTIATHKRPLQSPRGFSVNCTNVDAWDFTFLPNFAEPSSALVLFIPPRDWRKLAAGSLGDTLGFVLLALYTLALLVYALHVRLRVNRRSGFPRAVRRSIWRKILMVERKPEDRIRLLMALFNLKDGDRQKFLLKLLSTIKPGRTENFLKFFCTCENRDDIIKDRLKKLNSTDEAKSKEDIICSFEDGEFKDQLQSLKGQVLTVVESDENLKCLVVAFFSEPLDQQFDKVDDRDLLLMLDLFNVSMKAALAQPESRFGGQKDLYDVSKGKKYALIISNTFPTLKLALPKSQRLCTHHIGSGPYDNTDMKKIRTLLESMSFEVYCEQNLTKWKLLKTLERFRNKVRDNRGALAFVVIMSSVGFDSGFGILTADCEEVDHEDIMCGFDEPGRLAGVPKVFLFNTCVSSWTPEFSFHEGWDKKYGKLSSKKPRELVMRNSFRYQVLPDSKFRYKKSRRFIQDLKDTLLILPTPYFVTSREPCAASQFLSKLERTLPSPGFRFTLMELLSRVTPAVTPYSFRDLELERSSGK